MEFIFNSRKDYWRLGLVSSEEFLEKKAGGETTFPKHGNVMGLLRVSTPGAEKFDVIFHFLRGSGGDKAEQTAHLLAYRVALLLRQNQPRMRAHLRLKSAIVANIEAV